MDMGVQIRTMVKLVDWRQSTSTKLTISKAFKSKAQKRNDRKKKYCLTIGNGRHYAYKIRSKIDFVISCSPNPRLISSTSLCKSSPCIPSDVVMEWIVISIPQVPNIQYCLSFNWAYLIVSKCSIWILSLTKIPCSQCHIEWDHGILGPKLYPSNDFSKSKMGRVCITMNYLYLKAKYNHKLQWSYQIYIYNIFMGKKIPVRPKVYGTSGPALGGVPNQNCRVEFPIPTS